MLKKPARPAAAEPAGTIALAAVSPASAEASSLGFMINAIVIPKMVAKIEVHRYQRRTEAPSRPDFFSGSAAEPAISEKKMIGKTTILSIEIKTAPNGSRVSARWAKESLADCEAIRPRRTPRTKPVRIRLMSGMRK